MELTFVHFLIVCPLVFLAGVIDAVSGGGGLISLPAYMVAGLPPHMAIGTNKSSSAMGTTLATIRYIKSGYVVWKYAIPVIPLALLGSTLGANIALKVSDKYFTIVMLVALPLVALYVLKTKNLAREEKELKVVKAIFLSCIIAFVIGIYDGFFGPGTGTFLILALTTFVGFNLQHANGITKVINLSTNIAALTVYLINGTVLLPLGITAGVFNIFGNYIGSKMFDKDGARITKPFMIIVLVICFIKILWGVIS